MNKRTFYILVGAIIILILSLPGAFVLGRYTNENDDDNDKKDEDEKVTAQDDENDEEEDDLEVKEEDFKSDKVMVDTIKPDDVITKDTEIGGEALKGWYFEGDFPVYLKDQDGKTIGQGFATIDGSKFDGDTFYEYEGTNVPFKVTWTNFNPGDNQIGVISFEKDNPSGLEENEDSYEFPVRFDAAAKSMSVKVFYNNKIEDPNMMECGKVYESKRVISETLAVAKASIEELLKGPSAQEIADGFVSNIPEGVKLNSISIENGTAYIDFDNALQDKVGGSCRVSAIRAQIVETLKQFNSVEKVVISIEGQSEDILQP